MSSSLTRGSSREEVARRLAQLDEDDRRFSDQPKGSAYDSDGKYDVTLRTRERTSIKDFRQWFIDSSQTTLLVDLLSTGELRKYRNALNPHSGTGGAYIVPGETVDERLEQALVDTSSVRRLATVTREATAAAHLTPVIDDSANEGYIIAPNTAVTDQDPSFQGREFQPAKFSSGRVQASYSWLRDSSVGAPTLGDVLGRRIGRLQNRKFTVGTGSGEPQGIVPASYVAKTTASSTAFTIDELAELPAAVPEEYCNSPACVWMMAKATWLNLVRLKDGNGRYLWKASGLDRWPIVFNKHMPAFSTGNKPVLFGDISRYKITDVDALRIAQALETHVDTDSVTFWAYLESDGFLMDAGTHPTAVLQMA